MNVQAGDIINQYQIIDHIGEGGMGVVYLADDTRLQRKVALKFVATAPLDSSEEIARFHREARAAARLNHPNISTVYELGETEKRTYIAMEYVEGITLKERMRQGGIEEAEIRNWLEQIAEGLQTAHEAGVIHRDIKPANIMITDKGLIKIMDFGIAKLMESETELTQANSTIGTVAYMSPEQARGESIDRRTDIWSVGVILYELVTGQRPFGGAFREAVMYAMMHEEMRAPSEVNPDISADLERIINTCLKRERADRFESLKELLDALEGCDPGDVNAREEEGEETAVRVVKPSTARDVTVLGSKKRRLIAVAMVVLLGLFALLPGLRKQLTGSSDIETGLPSAMHLAVLPFDTISDSPEDQAFANGLAHIVATNLMQMDHDKEELWIIPVREVLSQNISSTQEAKESFGINMGISGTLITFGNTIQINIDLTDASTLRVLQSATIELDELDPQLVQGQVLSKLTDMLELGKPEDSNPMLAGLTSDPEAYKFYIQGQGFMQKYEELDNIDEAIRLFEKAIEIDSSYVLAYAGAGFAHARKYQFSREHESIEKARHLTQKALALNQDVPEVWVASARTHFETENYEEAISAAEKAVALDPESYDTNRMLAVAYAFNGDVEQAVPFFEKAIAIQPSYWDGYNAYALMYSVHDSNLEKAISLYEKAIELAPNNVWGYQNLGNLYRELGDVENAEYYYLKVLEIEPKANTYNNLGWMLWSKKDNKKAVEYFLEATALEPRNEMWTLFLGFGYMMVGDSTNARISWERAASLAQESLDRVGKGHTALYVGAEANARLGRREEAFIFLDLLLSLENNSAGYYFFDVALLYEALNNREDAIRNLEKAFQLGLPVSEVASYPWYTGLIADPAFQRLVDLYEER